jgi:LacI family repressor for deo operon, udp, cdd, tsx, nupC, and nupG
VAGVSTATVSRALQSPNIVSQKTRKAVFDAVSETGHSVNTAAQMLPRNRAGTVLVILPDIANPFFSKILSGIDKVATQANLMILIGNTSDENERFSNILKNLRNGRADGALLLNVRARPTDLLPDGVPILSISERIDNSAIPYVGTDNVKAAYDATTYLLSLGHRSVVHVTGPQGNSLTKDRHDDYAAAMRDPGLDDKSAAVAGGSAFRDGKRATVILLAEHQSSTAAFCANGESAMGVIRGLHEAGVDIPGEYSVMGFDEVPFAAIFQPELTTVHQARNLIGKPAMETLLALLGNNPAPADPAFLAHEIVTRQSTAKLIES